MTEPTALDLCVRARSRYEYEYSSAIRITDGAIAELTRLRACERELARRNGVVLCPNCFGYGDKPSNDNQGCAVCDGSGEIPVEGYREHVARLESDSRELAAMREGGVWLPKVPRDETVSTDDYFLVFNSMWKQWRAVRLVVNGTLPLMDCETAYGPLHEGRDDG